MSGVGAVGEDRERGGGLEVWGAVRPANFARINTGKAQFAQIQFASGGSANFRTIKSVKITNGRGYFDVKVKFPSSGQVRIAWQYPNQAWASNSYINSQGQTIYSRTTGISIR